MLERLLFVTLLLFMHSPNAITAQAAERPQKVRAQTVPAASTLPAAVAAPSILSIIPAQGEPGSKVTIFGGGFGDQADVFLGSVGIPSKVTEGKQVEFVIPKLDAGLYALFVKRGDGVAGRVYNFSVLPMRPALFSLTPEKISSCAQGAGREVTAHGRNFNEASVLLFDGAVIASRVVSREQILFTVPQVAGGLHHIMVKNDRDTGSLPLAITIETVPEISHVSIGNEYVNYYELNIHGTNFQQNSSIYVDGQRIGGKGGQEMAEREKLIFFDCTRLVYQRYPYSSTNKDFRIQVINQGGEGSQVINVTAP